jgi:hypothetical protein
VPLRELMDDRLLDELLDRSRDEAGGLRLAGEGSMLGELVKAVLERALEAELTAHLGYDKRGGRPAGAGNYRNGTIAKTVQTGVGPVGLAVPRDRAGTFEPVLVPKRAGRVAGGLDDMVISLYAHVFSSPNLGVFAVAAAGVLCAFRCVVDALPEQCLRRRSGADILVSAVFRTKRLRRERCAATCLRRRRPGQARRRQGRLQISIESLNYQLRKVTKARGHFPADDAVVKLLWLAIINIEDKRARERAARRQQTGKRSDQPARLVEGQRVAGWREALNELDSAYPGRL